MGNDFPLWIYDHELIYRKIHKMAPRWRHDILMKWELIRKTRNKQNSLKNNGKTQKNKYTNKGEKLFFLKLYGIVMIIGTI